MYSLNRGNLDFNDRVMPGLQEVYAQQVALESAYNRRETLHNLLEVFKNHSIQKDPAFKILFHSYLHTGSAFEGLQVKKVNEFDIDIVLKFPDAFNSQSEVQDAYPDSFGKFLFKSSVSSIILNTYRNEYSSLAQFFEFYGSGYLNNDKVRSWCQSLVDQFVYAFQRHEIRVPGIREIRSTNSGPARTLEIHLHSDPAKWISVDLVPVFIVRHQMRIASHNIVPIDKMNECILVPKPLKSSYLYQISPFEMPKLWRLHFPAAEESIMYNRGCLKPLIKLVKCLRDKENFDIPSYFIKTVAFHMVFKNPDPNYFQDSLLGIRFLQMLESLLDHLTRAYLPHIFFPGFNLFERLSRDNITQIKNRISKIIQEIKRDPNSIKSFFRSSRY